MKRIISILLISVLLAAVLAGCDRQSTEPAAQETQQAGSFEPETTSVASGGLVQAMDQTLDQTLESAAAPDAVDEAQDIAIDQPVVQDEAATQQPTAEPSLEPAPTVAETTAAPENIMPFATPTPQPNTAITSYSEVSGTGLGFKFSYPSHWNNIPGRSTVCYVQPLENGTVYPARVAVTMKKLAHKCTASEAQEELVEYLKTLMSQYDEATFKVDKNLNTSTKFMGKNGMSTTYLAYDGEQEIQGYVIMTYFERYLFCYHFLCAYEDYAAFEPAMRHMRDSVKVDQVQNADS